MGILNDQFGKGGRNPTRLVQVPDPLAQQFLPGCQNACRLVWRKKMQNGCERGQRLVDAVPVVCCRRSSSRLVLRLVGRQGWILHSMCPDVSRTDRSGMLNLCSFHRLCGDLCC